jgi:hypothetical protein
MPDLDSDLRDKRPLTTEWDRDDLPRFEEAAKVLSVRERGNFKRVDIIRMGARRFADQILGAEERA